jgi:DNA-binding response OmpR family regulator
MEMYNSYLRFINGRQEIIPKAKKTSGGVGFLANLKQEPKSSLRIDDRLSRAFWQGTPLDLSLTQFWILKDLVQHEGVARSTTELMRAANITVQPNTIVVHIKAIREAIQKLSPDFSCIKSERARGYRWISDEGD